MQAKTTTAASNASSRDGFVLLSVLMFVVLLVVLTSAAVFMTRQETRTGMANEQFDRAYRLAERGAADMVTDWRSYNLHTMPEWSAAFDTDTLSYGNWTGTIWKTGPLTFFINSSAQITLGNNLSGATRQVGMMARLLVPTLDVSAALMTQDSVLTRGSGQVIGTDSAPPEWGGLCVGTSDKPGVMIDDSTAVNVTGSSSVSGSVPAVDEDVAIADSTFTEFGDNTYNELVAMANKILPAGTYNQVKPVVVGGECDITAAQNWGDPLVPADPCGDYFPIIHILGNATLKGGGGPGNEARGQGILLVDGDFLMEGRASFYGIIITQGNFSTSSNGNKIIGGVYSGNLSGGYVDIAGSSIVQYSSCVVQYALERSSSARLKPFDERNWIDVSSMLW